MKNKLKKVMNIIPYLILLVSFVLLANVTISLSRGNTPTILGKGIFVVSTASMEETLMTGEVIFVDTGYEEYYEQEIITFHADINGDGTMEIVTHRIVDKYEEDGVIYYTTKGDNPLTNPTSNTWEIDITSDRIIGKYSSSSYSLTYLYSLIPNEENGYTFNKSIIFIVLIVVFIIVGGMEISNIVKLISKDKEEKALEEEKEKLVQEELARLRKEQKEKEE